MAIQKKQIELNTKSLQVMVSNNNNEN